MMHHSNCVVTLCDQDNRPFREYSHHREGDASRAKVSISYGTEYKFMFRIRDHLRRRVEFTIDGSQVGELIFEGNSQTYLERFIDSARKFKVVHPESSECQDPGNPKNGQVELTVWTEKAPPPPPPRPARRAFRSRGITGQTIGCSGMNSPVFGSSAGSLGSAGPEYEMLTNGAAATGEGGYSNQEFGSTTWRGDAGEPITFQFKIMGKEDEHAPNSKFFYCAKCGDQVPVGSNYCGRCGAHIASMNPDGCTIHLGIVLDESSSMEGDWDMTIDAINEYLDTLQGDDHRYRVSITAFNTVSRPVFHATDLTKDVRISRHNYRPNGMTALYDAIADGIGSLEDSVWDYDGKAMLVIMTDGQENSSRNFSLDRIRKLISSKERDGNWTFVYMGSHNDAWKHGSALGISKANVMQFDQAQAQPLMRAFGASTQAYASSADANSQAIFASNKADYKNIGATAIDDHKADC